MRRSLGVLVAVMLLAALPLTGCHRLGLVKSKPKTAASTTSSSQ